MGTLVRSQLESELTAMLGNRDDVSQTRLLIFLNLAQDRISRLRSWEELQSTQTGTLTYNQDDDDRFLSIPANTKDIYSFVVKDGTSSKKLDRKSARWFDQYIAAGEVWSRAQPTVYIRYKEQLELFRMPDQAYSYLMRLRLWPTAFVASSDVASDLDHKDDALLALAATWAFTTLNALDSAGRWWTVYTNAINDAIGEELERPDLEHLPHPGDMESAGDYWLNPWVREGL